MGQNLVDHILTGLDMVVLNTTLPLNIVNILNPISAFNYYTNGEGISVSKIKVLLAVSFPIDL